MTNHKQCISSHQPLLSSEESWSSNFPLPDWLGPVLERKLIHIGDFASNLSSVLFPPLEEPELDSLHLLIQSEAQMKTSISTQRTDVKSSNRDMSQLSSLAVIDRHGHLCQSASDRTPRLPNFSELVQMKIDRNNPVKMEVSVTTERLSKDQRFGKDLVSEKETLSNNLEQESSSKTHVEEPTSGEKSPVHVIAAVYDAEAPTKSVELRFSDRSALVDLIDGIPCTARAALPKASTEIRSTAVVFIEGSLYVDHRFDVSDYETPIHDFLTSRGKVVRIVQLSEQTILFSDLEIRLGQPYVFLHNGDCEHIFLFTDVYHDYSISRNKNKDESRHCEIWRRSPRVTPCDVCRARMAVKFTTKDPWVDTIPFHYCETCFTDAHYTREGKLFSQSEQLVVYDHPETL